VGGDAFAGTKVGSERRGAARIGIAGGIGASLSARRAPVFMRRAPPPSDGTGGSAWAGAGWLTTVHVDPYPARVMGCMGRALAAAFRCFPGP